MSSITFRHSASCLTFALLALLSPPPLSSATTLTDFCFPLDTARRRHETVDWVERYKVLRLKLQNRPETARQLAVSESIITAVEGDIRRGEGGTGWGVVKVMTTKGPMALKIISQGMFESISHSSQFNGRASIDEAIVQAELGERGWGLPVYGVLDKRALSDLMDRLPELRNMHRPENYGDKLGDPEWAYLMPYIESGYNPRFPQTTTKISPLPEFAKQWDKAAIMEWYGEAWKILDYLGLQATDLQTLIGKDGQPYLFDLGFIMVHDYQATSIKTQAEHDSVSYLSRNRGAFVNGQGSLLRNALEALQ